MSVHHQVILLAEDNAEDVLLFQRAFERAGLKHPIETVSNGTDCMAYLQGIPPYDNRTACPFPALLFLDIRLPR